MGEGVTALSLHCKDRESPRNFDVVPKGCAVHEFKRQKLSPHPIKLQTSVSALLACQNHICERFQLFAQVCFVTND